MEKGRVFKVTPVSRDKRDDGKFTKGDPRRVREDDISSYREWREDNYSGDLTVFVLKGGHQVIFESSVEKVDEAFELIDLT